MTITDFKKTIESLGIINDYDGKDIILWNDIEIRLSNSYYAIVNGKIPKEVAEKISYYSEDYGIRIKGGNDTKNPLAYMTSDIIEATKGKIINKKNFDKHSEISLIIEQLKHYSPNEDLYLNNYHIDTKEGLIILVTELQDYYLKKILGSKFNESQVSKQDDYNASVTRKLFEDCNIKDIIKNSLNKQNKSGDNLKTRIEMDIEREIKKFDSLINFFNIDCDYKEFLANGFSISAYSNNKNQMNAVISSKNINITIKVLNSELLFKVDENKKDKKFTFSHHINGNRSDKVEIYMNGNSVTYNLNTSLATGEKISSKVVSIGIKPFILEVLQNLNELLLEINNNITIKEETKQKVK